MKNFVKSVAALLAAAFLINCSGSSGGSDGGSTVAPLVISGKLGTQAAMSVGGNSSMAVTLTDLELYAIAFTSPPAIASATVNADGSFSVSIPGAKGHAVTAIFRDKNDQSQVGTVVFEDTSSKDLNGNASQSSSIVLKDSVQLGNITLGTDGKVKIPVTQIADVIGTTPSVSAGTAFDFTGVWYMKAYDGTLPTGYQTVTADCSHGPCIGFPITLVRMAGKKFTATSNCVPSGNSVTCAVTDGTVGTEDRYALSIWGDNFANGIGACGSVTGFSADMARAAGQIHIASLPTVAGNTINFGDYVYTTPTGFGGDASPYNLPWMKTGARALHAESDCRPISISHSSNNFNGWACKAKVMTGAWPGSAVAGPVYGWQVGVEGGGCFNTTTGKPVNVTNWSTMGMGTCTHSDSSATYGAGFNTDTCTYSNVDHDGDSATPPINLSCTNTGGQFTDSSGSPTTTPMTFNTGEYLGQPETLLAYNALCSSAGSATTPAKLAAYRCYAENYWSSINSASGGNCRREYHFNWSATTPANFAEDNDRGKPKNAFITNILAYTADGQTATVEDEETDHMTIPTGPNSSTFCETSRRTVISFKKISATRMLADLRQSGQMNSTDAACLGAAKDALAGKNVGGGDLQHVLTPENMMFYLDTTN